MSKLEVSEKTADIYAPCVVPVSEISISVQRLRELAVTGAMDKLNDAFFSLLKGAEDQSQHIVFTNHPVLIPAGCPKLLVEDFRRTKPQINNTAQKWGDGVIRAAEESRLPKTLIWSYPTSTEAKKIYTSLHPQFEEATYQEGNTLKYVEAISYREDAGRAPSSALMIRGNSNTPYGGENSCAAMDLHVSYIPPKQSLERFILDERLIPDYLTKRQQEVLSLFYTMLDGEYLEVIDEDGELDFEVGRKIAETEGQTLLLSLSSLSPASSDPMLPREIADQLMDELLCADQQRADIIPEDKRKLEDPNGGIWELWEYIGTEKGEKTAKLPYTVYARIPRMDVLEGGVIGIDFGTKSTVVTCLSGEDGEDTIRPLRIGTGRYDMEVSLSDYENPTVVEFKDLQNFLSDYRASRGRPHTLWPTLTVSHTAERNMAAIDMRDTARYSAAYFSGLKQWASGTFKNVRIRDLESTEAEEEGVILPPYLLLQEDDIDPIEYYAYYIGLYINNMRMRHIYLRYMLSFPVTFEKEVREHILYSFQKGLRKSMPQSILEDTWCMDRFQVEEGVAEPAAYAVCALQEFGFDPQPEEKVFFSVFDFGGGTTDFDFGIWRKATGPKERRYRYVMQHFGAGGDRNLGGEGLLAELAYQVFVENKDTLRNSQIQFTRPPEGALFPGHEVLIDNTQEAMTNTRNLIEALRPLWERESGNTNVLFGDGVCRCKFYRRDGMHMEINLDVNEESLMSSLRKRIEDGVDQFFEGLFATIRGPIKEYMNEITTYNIFLAGNSSRSVLVHDAFRREIEQLDQQIWEQEQKHKSSQGKSKDRSELQSHFALYYPLGTPEADQQRKTGGRAVASDCRPTCKTGVAFGLLQCRRGGKIRVLSEVGENNEPKFRYWVGDDVDGHLHYYLSRDSAYNEWVEFWPAEVSDFEFRYTMSPGASRQDCLPTQETKLRRCTFPRDVENEDWVICLRPVKPEELEYVVAETVEAANKGEYQCEPVRVNLKQK